MSTRRKTQQNSGNAGSMYSTQIDLNPGITIPNARFYGVEPVGTLHTYEDITNNEKYYTVEVSLTRNMASTVQGKLIYQLAVSVGHIEDDNDKFAIAILERIARKIGDIQGTRTDTHLKTCGYPKNSKYEVKYKIIADEFVWAKLETAIPFMWKDEAPVLENTDFRHDNDKELYQWSRTSKPDVMPIDFKVKQIR